MVRISQDQCNLIRNVVTIVRILLKSGTTAATPERLFSMTDFLKDFKIRKADIITDFIWFYISLY